MIRFFLVVEMANTGAMRRVSILLRPVDCFVLCFERGQCVVGVIFDNIIVDVTTLGSAFGSGLHINCRPCSHLLARTQPFITPLNVILHEDPIFPKDVFVSLGIDCLGEPFN